MGKTLFKKSVAIPPSAPSIAWTSIQEATTPTFNITAAADFTWQVGDIVTLYRDDGGGEDSYTATVTEVDTVNTLDFASGVWPDETYDVEMTITRDGAESARSNTEVVTIFADPPEVTYDVLATPTPSFRSFGGSAWTFNAVGDVHNGDDLILLLACDQDPNNNNFAVTLGGVTMTQILGIVAASNFFEAAFRITNWAGGTVSNPTVSIDPTGTPYYLGATLIRVDTADPGVFASGREVKASANDMSIATVQIPAYGLGLCWGWNYRGSGSATTDRTPGTDCVAIHNAELNGGGTHAFRFLAESCVVAGNPKTMAWSAVANFPQRGASMIVLEVA